MASKKRLTKGQKEYLAKLRDPRWQKYRDEVYNPGGESEGMAEVIVAKHRNGPTGTINLGFLPRFTAFKNLTRRDV